MAHLGYDKNKYGTRISKHRCDACGVEFTLCPAVFPETKGWDYCLRPDCASYDSSRDLEKLFDERGYLKDGVILTKGPAVGSA